MKKILMLLGMAVCFASTPAFAAGIGLALTHTVVSQQQTVAGTDVTLDVAVHNPSAETLTNVSIELADPVGMAQAGGNALSVTSLAANGDATATWTISVTDPAFDVAAPIALRVTGTDSTGATLDFSAVSVAR